jgi:membrane protease YdiL (CAAX protease family)
LTTIIASIVALALALTLIFLNERFALFSQDRFPTTTHKWLAYAWMSVLLVMMTFMVVGASTTRTAPDPANLEFYSLFSFHMILVIFLAGWWFLAGRPGLREYMNVRFKKPLEDVLIGVAVGVGGWAVTLGVAATIGLALQAAGLIPDDIKPSPVIPWMAGLEFWKKCLIVLSAMTVEEAFFRGWLQKRVGLVISTIIFVLAHAGYGQPLMFIGITVVSVIIAFAFYKTKNLVPCIIAHGIFDAIQLFVIVPFAVQMLPK